MKEKLFDIDSAFADYRQALSLSPGGNALALEALKRLGVES